MIKKSLIKKYARLIVRVGANVKKGQAVLIQAAIDQGAFVKYIVEEAYKAGASRVEVEWSFDALTKLHYRYQETEMLSLFPEWREKKLAAQSDELPCLIKLLSEDPDGLSGLSPEKMQKVQQAHYKVVKKYRDEMEGKQQWTIAAAPSVAWAKKVFPEETVSAAVEKLWKAILKTVYVDETNDPELSWREHNESFAKKCKKLNDYKFTRLEYKSGNGTDFSVGLIPGVKWEGGGERTIFNNYFNPNMPTEEIFTSPMSGAAEGTVVATKPLCYKGQLIEGFRITFENGRAASWSAERGEELLGKMLACDEGAARLGELALVPEDSPVSELGILFYNTLFDENASCHLAMGEGFVNLVDGYEDKSLEELRKLGINDSMIHVDFMIGAPDLSIKGYTVSGECVEVFKEGKWAV